MWVCRLPVHIGPAGCTGFTEIFGEFVTSHWADRVVGPYSEASMHTYPVGADDSVRPQDISVLRKSSANSQLPSGPMWASAPTECCEYSQLPIGRSSAAYGLTDNKRSTL